MSLLKPVANVRPLDELSSEDLMRIRESTSAHADGAKAELDRLVREDAGLTIVIAAWKDWQSLVTELSGLDLILAHVRAKERGRV